MGEVGTLRGRAEDDSDTTREVTTQDVVPCAEGQCSEIRRLSDGSFSSERAADAGGPGLATTTQFMMYLVSRAAARRSVAIDVVRQPWQQPPPGAGTTARLYEIQAFGDSARPGDRIRIVVDDSTGLPIGLSEIGRDGRIDSRVRWSYTRESRSRSEFPPDFFLVPEPTGAR